MDGRAGATTKKKTPGQAWGFYIAATELCRPVRDQADVFAPAIQVTVKVATKQ
jgi:hypothetical protein